MAATLSDGVKGGSSAVKEGENYSSATNPHSERKPSEYETPVSPTSSSVSSQSVETTSIRERRYVSAPKLPQSECEALDNEGGRSPLMQEIISEQYIDMRSGGTAVLHPLALHPVPEQVDSEYTYIDENKLSTDAPSSYEYIDECDRTSFLTKTNVRHL